MYRRPIPQIFAPAILIATAAFFVPTPADAAGGIERFQHGGRATAQAGALTARADEPSAVTYNPAGITQLLGLQVQGNLDFVNATDEYNSASGRFSANHSIQFPPSVYATWRRDANTPWAFGVGLDTPYWYRTDFNPALFPGRFTTRVSELRLYELHAVAAFQLDANWSFGGGLRYLNGAYDYGFNFAGVFDGGPGSQIPFELSTEASSSVDAVSFDLAVHYDANVWGWGAVYRHSADLEEDGADFDVSLRDITDPSFSDPVLATFDYNRAKLGFDLPAELRGGFWFAPYPELRVEVDASFQTWSSLDDTDVTIRSPTQDAIVVRQPRDWDDTFSIRIGAEGEISEEWSVAGGLAFEPSPIPDSTVEPGFPRGDSLVYSLGGSYNLPDISFDVGYSFHDFDSRSASGQEPDPTISGRYEGKDQVWAVTARWRL